MFSSIDDSILFIHTKEKRYLFTIDSTDIHNWDETWKHKGKLIYYFGNRNIKTFIDSSEYITTETHKLFKDCDFHFDGLILKLV